MIHSEEIESFRSVTTENPMRRSLPYFALFGFLLLVLVPGYGFAQQKSKVVHRTGFRTSLPAPRFPAYWERVKLRHKMKENVSDHLTMAQIDSIIMLEVNIAIAVGPGIPTLQDQLLAFMAKGNRFTTEPLTKELLKTLRKHLVGVIRTKKGEYGLITKYSRFTVLELNGYIGVVPGG